MTAKILLGFLLSVVACGPLGSRVDETTDAAMSVVVKPAPLEPPAHHARGPLIVNLWGQSNSLGEGVYVGTFPGDARVTYYDLGVLRPFAPRTTSNPADGRFGVVGTHGIELSVGPALADATGRPIVITKAAVGATWSAEWLPIPGSELWHWEVSAVDAVRPDMEDADIHVCTQQGELDAQEGQIGITTAGYLTNFTAIVAGFRALYAPHRVFVHVGLVNTHIPGNPAKIQAAQREYVATDPDSDLIDLDDVTPADAFHYSSAQIFETVGPRFTAAILREL